MTMTRNVNHLTVTSGVEHCKGQYNKTFFNYSYLLYTCIQPNGGSTLAY